MRFLTNLLNSFGGKSGWSSQEGGASSLERVERMLDHLPPDRARNLAVMALLLGRVAHADEVVSEEERTRMKDILASDLHLDEEQAAAVTDLALQKDLCLSLDRHLVLQHIRESIPHDERLDLVRSLFRLAAVHDISSQESEEIRLITKGMVLSHGDYIALRSEFRDHLTLLKNLPE